jgi:hypothetical protein
MGSLQAPDRLHRRRRHVSATNHPKGSRRPMGLRLGLELLMASGLASGIGMTKQQVSGFPVPVVTSRSRR